MVYGHVIYIHIFHHSLVNAFKCESAAIFAFTVEYLDISVASVTLRTEFYPSAYPSHRLWNLGSVKVGTALIAGYGAVLHRNILAWHDGLQCVGTLQYYAIIMRSIHHTVLYYKILATIYIHTVTVSINGDAIYYCILTSGNDNGKMSATVYRHVTNPYVLTQFECYGLVTGIYTAAFNYACLFLIFLGQSHTVDEAFARHCYILFPIGPYQ